LRPDCSADVKYAPFLHPSSKRGNRGNFTFTFLSDSMVDEDHYFMPIFTFLLTVWVSISLTQLSYIRCLRDFDEGGGQKLQNMELH
jgi:hypothetical protein